jgi:hypothetical protein
MAYGAEISRGNPTCFIFLLDQSGSMADKFGGEHAVRKADFVADAVNRTLHDLVIRCTKTEEVRNYYDIAVIGYGAKVQPVLSGALAGKILTPISELADSPARVERRNKKIPDGAGGIVEQQIGFPIWVDPGAAGKTPMCQAFELVKSTLEEWLLEHKTGFPPIVLHLTDGESTDGDPTDLGRQIGGYATQDGEVLLLNCHVSSQYRGKVQYPSDESDLPDDFAKMLFRISSVLPEPFCRAGEQIGLDVAPGARGCVFNGDPVAVAQFFDIGTRPANLR